MLFWTRADVREEQAAMAAEERARVEADRRATRPAELAGNGRPPVNKEPTPAAADDKKEPSTKAQEAAKVLKGNLAKFALHLYGVGVKADPSAVRLFTDKDLVIAGEKGAFVIPEEQARAAIDGLVRAGQFDKPPYEPGPGISSPGWYLMVTIGERRLARPSVLHWWRLGAADYDLSTDPVVRQLLKALEGDSKAALERLGRREPTKPR
jgi:hypothetical protein